MVSILPSILSGCAAKPFTALDGWHAKSKTQADIRLLILSYAILAPNAHNIQPWWVKLTSPLEFELYIDQDRLLPETDPYARQIHISHGAFIELLDLAARYYGYLIDIHYFPQGMLDNTLVSDKPIAHIQIIKSKIAEPDHLFNSIFDRVSNKRKYDDKPISTDILTQLTLALYEDVSSLSFTNDPRLLKTISSITNSAMQIETEDHRRNDETLQMFRFNDAELEQYRDGLSIDQAGVSGIKKAIAETFFVTRHKAMNDKSAFSKEAINLTQMQADSAMAWAWLTTKNNTRQEQILIGRTYARVHLKATELGLAMQPLSQILQEYDDMSTLQKRFFKLLKIPKGHTVQMLFRLGYAPTVRHTVRRKLENIITRRF